MVLRAVGGVAQLLPRRTYPWKLFGLLLPGPDALAKEISRDVACLRCPFSKQVCERFSSPEALQSLECRAILFAVGQLARLETSSIECRHATIRRWGRARSQTHAEGIRRASAAFVLWRHRVCQAGFWSKAEAVPRRTRESRPGPTLRPRQRCPGAGPQRLSVARFLKGKRMKTPAERRQAFLEANRLFKIAKEQGGEVYDELVRTGAVGKQARLAGGQAFGGGRKRQRVEDSDLSVVSGKCAPQALQACGFRGKSGLTQGRLRKQFSHRLGRLLENKGCFIFWSPFGLGARMPRQQNTS